MTWTETITAFFAHHPTLTIAIAFLASLGEALIVIGLFVPSTVVLIGAGTLVGLGKLSFWPLFIAATLGAIAGDAISYWAGRFYGQRLKIIWPLRHYPELVIRGETFFARHGMKSVAIGRFIPGVKAIIPGIAGMLGMSNARFTIINALSAMAWAGAHVVSGVLVGLGVAWVHGISPRLAILLLALLIFIALIGWLARVALLWVSPQLEHAQMAVAAWARTRRGWVFRSLARALDPLHPHALTVLFWGGVLLGAVIGLTGIIEDLLKQKAHLALDTTILNALGQLRTPMGDALMIAIAMLGDGVVLSALAVAILAWLLWHRLWYSASVAGAAFAFAALFEPLMKLVFQRARPAELYSGIEALSFPSGHAALSATVFGILAVLVSIGYPRWTKAVIFSIFAALVTAIAFSRVYLYAHWPSDVAAGLMFGVIMTAAFALAVMPVSARAAGSRGLTVAALIVFAAVAGGHLMMGYTAAQARYQGAPQRSPEIMEVRQWLDGGWQKLPQRLDAFLGDDAGEIFFLQWAGPLTPLRAALTAQGWQDWQQWRWRDLMTYLDIRSPYQTLPPLPLSNRGRLPALTLSKPVGSSAQERTVLRLWPTDFMLGSTTGLMPIYVALLTHERLSRPYRLLTISERSLALPARQSALGDELRRIALSRKVQTRQVVGAHGPVLLIAWDGKRS